MVLECLDFSAEVAWQQAAGRKSLRREDDDRADDDGTNDKKDVDSEP
jgi:hypothetical protein